jgi:hypothetical protein
MRWVGRWHVWGRGEVRTVLWCGCLKERDHLEETRKWMYNIKMNPKNEEWRGMNWVDLVQDRDRWRVLVSAVMNHRVA